MAPESAGDGERMGRPFPSRGWLARWLGLVEPVAWAVSITAVAGSLVLLVQFYRYRPRTLVSCIELATTGSVRQALPKARKLPRPVNSLHQMARRYAGDGLLDEAGRTYMRLLHWTPDLYDYNYEYANLLYDIGSMAEKAGRAGRARGAYEKAEEYFRRALAVRPGDRNALLGLANAVFGLGKPEMALDYAESALYGPGGEQGGAKPGACDDDVIRLYKNVGKYYFSRGRWDDAITLFVKSDREERNPDIQYMIALSLVEKCLSSRGLLHRLACRVGLSEVLDAETRAEVARRVARCLELDGLHRGALELKNRYLK